MHLKFPLQSFKKRPHECVVGMQENGPGVRVPEQGSKSDVISRSPGRYLLSHRLHLSGCFWILCGLTFFCDAGDRLCSVCKEKKSKYRCPACQAASCSLECSKKHKELTGQQSCLPCDIMYCYSCCWMYTTAWFRNEAALAAIGFPFSRAYSSLVNSTECGTGLNTGCTGKRNRTEFISLGDFNDSRLMSDYHVLEEAAAAAESAARGRSRSSQDADQNRQLRRQASLHPRLGKHTYQAVLPSDCDSLLCLALSAAGRQGDFWWTGILLIAVAYAGDN